MYRMRIRNESELNELEIYITSNIEPENFAEGEYVSARKIMLQIPENFTGKIILHINSDGGDLFEALAIYDLLMELSNSGCEVEARIEGLCASSASVIAMGADKIIMNANAYMFIHEALGGTFGDSEELAGYSELLQDMTGKIIKIYASRTGLSEDTVKDLLHKESWMDANTCKTLGFCDEIIEPEKKLPVQIENRRRDSRNIQVSNVFKPVNRDSEAIQNMARIINQRRGYKDAR